MSRKGTMLVAGSFLASGAIHLARPQVFYPLIPDALGDKRAWTYASGVAEIACGIGLLTRQRWAPAATTAVLAGVWVGNWTYAIRVQQSSRTSTAHKAVAWARIPLQLPMMRAAWTADRRRSDQR